MKMRWVPCLVLLAACWCADTSRAAPVRVDFAGTVAFLSPSGGELPAWFQSLGPSITPGTAFSGFFTFDEAQPNTQGGLYQFAVPPWSLATTLGTLQLSSLSGYQIYLITTPGDEPANINLTSSLFPSIVVSPGVSASFLLYLKDRFGRPLPSTDLDDVPWDLALYPDSSVSWVLRNSLFPGQDVLVYGTLGSLSGPPHVAEPSAASMLTAAALALLCAHFRRAAG